jgi:murein L,D-transpeptidase YafK
VYGYNADLMIHRSALAIFLVAVLSAAYGETSPKIDKVLIVKSQRKLMLMSGSTMVKTYRIALGTNPIGPKTIVGDGRTPEGSYVIDSRNANSQYHKSLHLSYPNAEDRARARKLGKSPGGDIYIHGLPKRWAWVGKAHVATDWTLGCIALTNDEIEEIWRLVPDGTPVEIRP